MEDKYLEGNSIICPKCKQIRVLSNDETRKYNKVKNLEECGTFVNRLLRSNLIRQEDKKLLVRIKHLIKKNIKNLKISKIF